MRNVKGSVWYSQGTLQYEGTMRGWAFVSLTVNGQAIDLNAGTIEERLVLEELAFEARERYNERGE